MIFYFLESHMKLYNEKKKLIELNFNTNIDLIKTYKHIIYNNFSNNKIKQLFKKFFYKNISFKKFEQFRNILLKPIDNFYDFLLKYNYFNLVEDDYNERINIIKYYRLYPVTTINPFETVHLNIEYYLEPIVKFVYVSHQYHKIIEYRLKIMDLLKDGLNKIKNKLFIKRNEHIKIIESFSNFIKKYSHKKSKNPKKEKIFLRNLVDKEIYQTINNYIENNLDIPPFSNDINDIDWESDIKKIKNYFNIKFDVIKNHNNYKIILNNNSKLISIVTDNIIIDKILEDKNNDNFIKKSYINQLQRLNYNEQQALWREAEAQARIEETKELMKFMVSQVKQRWKTERMMKMEYKANMDTVLMLKTKEAVETRRALGLHASATLKELTIARAKHLAMSHNRETNVLNLDMPAITERARLRKENNEQKRLEEIVKFKEQEQVTQWEHITTSINKCLCWLFKK